MEQKNGSGPIFGIIIILIVIAVGGFYFTKEKTSGPKQEANLEMENSDDLSAIEASLQDLGLNATTSAELELNIE